MIYYLLVGLSGIIFATGLIVFRQRFFDTLEAMVGLSNAVLSDEDELVKQKRLVNALKRMLLALLLVIVTIAVIIGLTILPLYIYGLIINQPFGSLDFGSWQFFLCLSVGSVFPFIIRRKKSSENYSEVSKLLHRLILDNYYVSKKLFSLDKRFKKTKNLEVKNEFLIVSGLARAGTTSLTSQLFKSGNFSSLDYSNMPFLLAPNLWRKIYNPKKAKLKERQHGDKVLFGYNTVEALEEHFFKAFLNDSFIEEDALAKHKLTDEVYTQYLKYQTRIRGDKRDMYLAKNNNMLLRYASLREYNSEFRIIFMFRTPVVHAFSLLNQHRRFVKLQNEDDFVERYMNWLGHHEFGNNQKIFRFTDRLADIEYDKDSLNYWLSIWLNYYDYLLSLKAESFTLLEYDDYLNYPKQMVEYAGQLINMPLDTTHIERFNNSRDVDISDCDEELLKSCNALYRQLQERKVKFPIV